MSITQLLLKMLGVTQRAAPKLEEEKGNLLINGLPGEVEENVGWIAKVKLGVNRVV